MDIETRVRQVMQAEAERARPEQLRPMRVNPPERRVSRSSWLAPVAVALVVAMTITGVAVAVRASGLLGGARGKSQPTSGAFSKPPWPTGGNRMPAYYVAIEFGKANRSTLAVTMTAVVRSSATGALLARTPLPSLNGSAGGPLISAAGDDRHFAISMPTGPSGVTRFYLLTLDASGRKPSLARLPVEPIPAAEAVGGIALSPDGTQFAIAMGFSGPATSYHRQAPTAEMKVVNLVTGSARAWTTRRASALVEGPSEPSWADNGRLLGFLWNAHAGVPDRGLYLLNTAAPGSNLMAARRLIRGAGVGLDAYLTANGQAVIADMAAPDRMPGAPLNYSYPSIVEYSARTGHLIRTLYGPPHAPTAAGYSVVSVDPSGKYLLVSAPHFGRLINGKFTPLAYKPNAVPLAAW